MQVPRSEGKEVSYLLQVGASAYLFSSLGNTLFMLLLVHVCMCVHLPVCVFVGICVCVLVCMTVCVSLCVCLCAWMGMCITLFLPPSLLSCSVLFHFFPLTPTVGNKHWLSLSSLRSSFRSRDQVGGKMLCRNARPSSGSWASVSSHS